MGVIFDFSELRGLIVAKYGNCANFAPAAKLSKAQLSDRLNNKVDFKPEDIHLICSKEVLNIAAEQIGKYFFTPKV